MLGVALVVGACSDDSFDLPPFERIEDVEFAPELGVDLDEMTRLESGVFILNVVEGEGELVQSGDLVETIVTARLRDGTVLPNTDNAEFSFVMDDLNTAVEGFHEGIRGMRVGGERKMVVPPELAFNTRGEEGIIIFDVEIVSVSR